MEFKLYVGNLAYSTTEQDLQALFAQAGEVISVDLVKDKDSGQSRGFAFVTMASQAAAQKAIDLFDKYVLADRALRVNPAKPKRERGDYQSRLSAFSAAGQEPTANTSKPRKERSGYQSRLSAFSSSGKRSPRSPRRPRRGGRS